MNKIKIETNGIILNGEFANWNIFIEDLDNGNGAYLILLTSPDKLTSYDDWVQNLNSLEGYFNEAQWKVQWLDERIYPKDVYPK
jgi:hypothetical protein